MNAFPLYYKTKYWLWIDNPKFGNYVYILDNDNYVPYFKFEPNFDIEEDLFGRYTIATFAIHLAIKLGYKKVILYGILDGTYKDVGNNHYEYYHFYDNEPHKFHKYNLKAWNDEILNNEFYSEQIEIIIPSYNVPEIK